MENLESKDLSVNSIDNKKNSEDLKEVIKNINPDDVNTMNKVADKIGQQSNELDQESINSFIKTVSEKWTPETMEKLARSFKISDSLSNKVNSETLNTFVDKVTEKWNDESMNEVAQCLGKNSFLGKTSKENVENFVKAVYRDKNNTESKDGVAEVFGNDSFLDKVSDETLENFVKTVSEEWRVNTIYKLSKNLGNELFVKKTAKVINEYINKAPKWWELVMGEIAKHLRTNSLVKNISGKTINSFTKEALNNKYEDCIKEIGNNKDVMDKLDESIKSEVNEYNSSLDKMIDNAKW